jgi:hypothetical protein
MNMEYKIYQLKSNEEGYKYMFRRYDENNVPSKSLYNVVYSGEVESSENVMDVLEGLYVTFNVNHPADFKGHSLSVSDVVELDGKYYYCDSFGYVELKKW